MDTGKLGQCNASSSSNSYRKTENHGTKDHLPLHMRNLIEQKRKARQIWQRTRYPTNTNLTNKKITRGNKTNKD